MKTLKASLLALMVATPSFAGGLSAPVEEPTVAPAAIAEDTASSSRAGILVPLFALLLIGLAASSGGNDAPPLPQG